MNDAVKPAVSDEMVELFGINFWPINAASKIDAQREHIRNALSAALTAPAQPAENDIADAVLSWMVEHDLLDAGNEYQAPDVLAVLDDLAPAQPVGVPVGYVSTGELHTLQQTDTCVDLFSTPPEDGFQFVPVYAASQPPTEDGRAKDSFGNDLIERELVSIVLRMTRFMPGDKPAAKKLHDGAIDYLRRKSLLPSPLRTEETIVQSASQPPAEGGWKPIESAPEGGRIFLGWDGYHIWPCTKFDNVIAIGQAVIGIMDGKNVSHWQPMPLPPAPANGGEQNG